jgi:two-component system sensor kinase FixL
MAASNFVMLFVLASAPQSEGDIARRCHVAASDLHATMLGALAHELNQPLAAMRSNAQAALRFLAHGTPDIEQVRDILHDIVADNRRADGIIQGWRRLLQNGAIQHDALDVRELVDDVLQLVRADLLRAHIDCVTALAPDLPRVTGDRVLLQQVLLNLVTNGCEAMLDVLCADRQLVVTAARGPDHFVEVCVTDKGCGISAAMLEQIFTPLLTTKPAGLGLGLTVCHQIITAHGGHLWATNNGGQGASLHFTMPIKAEEWA